MSKKSRKSQSQTIALGPSEGRFYDMGKISSIFKADGKETGGKYSISEWWIEANTKGPGIHRHDEDDIFYVLEGTMSIYLDGKWIDAKKGSFILVPAGMEHDFENRSSEKAGVLNFSVPGDFEQVMPSIVNWFQKNPAGVT